MNWAQCEECMKKFTRKYLMASGIALVYNSPAAVLWGLKPSARGILVLLILVVVISMSVGSILYEEMKEMHEEHRMKAFGG